MYHVKKETIIAKLLPCWPSMQSVKVLRLVNNGIESLKQVHYLFKGFVLTYFQLEILSEIFCSSLTNLVIKDNVVCVLKNTLKMYVIVKLPVLKQFNDEDITEEDRRLAIHAMTPYFSVILQYQDGQSKCFSYLFFRH